MLTIPWQDFWLWLELLPWVQFIAATWWFPLINSLHVLAICLMLGMLLMADLNLLGVAVLSGPLRQSLHELWPWTLASFLVAMTTGVLLFLTRAASHVMNPAFQWKMLLLLLAGINVLVFYRRLYPAVSAADAPGSSSWPLRVSAAVSLLLWSGVMLSGRWIGHVFG